MEKCVVMISGANRGIGLEIAKALYEESNFYLSLGVRTPQDFDGASHFTHDDRILINHYDANDNQSAEAWINKTIEVYGQIDGLINNAGILKSCGIENYHEDAFDDMWQINTKAPIKLTTLAWEHLKKSGRSRVINIVSVAGKTTRPDEFGYNLTKHALLAFTHSVRKAGWHHGIRATAICPGWVNTDMANSADICQMEPADMTQPEDVARLVITVLKLPNNASMAEVVVNAHCGEYF